MNREDLSGGRSVSDKEAPVTTSDCSKLEGHNMPDVSAFEDEQHPNHLMTTISEKETKQIAEVIAPGSQSDLSIISKSLLEEESMVPSGPDEDLTPPVINTEKSYGILGMEVSLVAIYMLFSFCLKSLLASLLSS